MHPALHGARYALVKRILVTGASGFIGRALVAHLARKGYAVRAASRTPATATPTDKPVETGIDMVVSPDLSGEADWGPLLEGVDAVVHAAAIAHTQGMDASAYEAVNRRAAVALARAARGKVERLVFLSSIRAQSGPTSLTVLTEADAPRPTDAYGRSKLEAETALGRLDMPFVILRPVLVAGCRPRGNLAMMLRLARLGVPLSLDRLAARRSLVALADVASAVAHVLVSPSHLGSTYILAHPEPIPVGTMFAALREGLGRATRGPAVPEGLLRAALAIPGMANVREKLLGDLVASPARLMGTGWTPRTSPREALLEIGAALARDGGDLSTPAA